MNWVEVQFIPHCKLRFRSYFGNLIFSLHRRKHGSPLDNRATLLLRVFISKYLFVNFVGQSSNSAKKKCTLPLNTPPY